MKVWTQFVVVAVSMFLATVGFAEAQHKPKQQTPPGLAKKGGKPPGQAKRGCLPPGIAKRLSESGRKAACATYVAVDPEDTSRAWLLIGGQWVLESGFEVDIRGELRSQLNLQLPAPPPPPIPLPQVEVTLEVMLFGD